MTLKVGLIGAGRRAQSTHLKVLEELRKDRIVFAAVCDINPETVNSVAKRYRVNGYTNVRDMIAKEKLDVCIVTVPIDAHHSISCLLSENGIHQLVETPIATHPILAQYMIDTAQKNGVKLEISENFPSMPVELMSMEILRSKALGEVGRIYRLFSTMFYHGVSVMNERSGGNPIKVHSLKHEFPVIPYTDKANRTFDKEELEYGAIYYDNGAMGIFMVGNKNSALGRNKLVGFEVDCEKGVLITNGNQGALGGEEVRIVTKETLANGGRTISVPFQREYAEIGNTKVIQRMWVDLPDIGRLSWENAFGKYSLEESIVPVAYMHESIYSAIESNAPLVYTPERAKLDLEILLAMEYSSARDGAGVSLPLQLDPDEEHKLKESFQSKYGRDPFDIEGLVDISFPRV